MHSQSTSNWQDTSSYRDSRQATGKFQVYLEWQPFLMSGGTPHACPPASLTLRAHICCCSGGISGGQPRLGGCSSNRDGPAEATNSKTAIEREIVGVAGAEPSPATGTRVPFPTCSRKRGQPGVGEGAAVAAESKRPRRRSHRRHHHRRSQGTVRAAAGVAAGAAAGTAVWTAAGSARASVAAEEVPAGKSSRHSPALPGPKPARRPCLGKPA